MLLVGLIQMTTVFSYAKKGVPHDKEKYANVSPVCPLQGEALELGNQISWQKMGNEDVKFFIIQRSKDGQQFKHLAMIEAKDSQDIYSFLDKKPGAEQWFYRIIRVNRHGEGYFTESISLK